MFPIIDFSTIIIASVILDVEPLVVLLLGLPMPIHGFFHTYLGATIVAGILSICLWPFRSYLNMVVSYFGIHQKSNLRTIVLASIAGTYSHVFLDSFLYAEMNPFYPLLGNLFFSFAFSQFIYNFCVFAGFLGLVGYIIHVLYVSSKPKPSQEQLDIFE